MGAGFGGGYSLSVSGDDRGERFLARLLARKPAEDQEAEALVRWGAASDFIKALGGEQFIPTISTVNWPEFPGGGESEEEEEEEKEIPVVDWTEMSRTTSDVRVENPDDEEQYVIVQRIETITFQTARGERIRLNFRNGDV